MQIISLFIFFNHLLIDQIFHHKQKDIENLGIHCRKKKKHWKSKSRVWKNTKVNQHISIIKYHFFLNIRIFDRKIYAQNENENKTNWKSEIKIS